MTWASSTASSPSSPATTTSSDSPPLPVLRRPSRAAEGGRGLSPEFPGQGNGLPLTTGPAFLIIKEQGRKVNRWYVGAPARARKREAGENPAQCRCCVSGVFSNYVTGEFPWEGRKTRLTLQPEYLPAYDARMSSPCIGRVQRPRCPAAGWWLCPLWGAAFCFPLAFHPLSRWDVLTCGAALCPAGACVCQHSRPGPLHHPPALPAADGCGTRAVLPGKLCIWERPRRSGPPRMCHFTEPPPCAHPPPPADGRAMPAGSIRKVVYP